MRKACAASLAAAALAAALAPVSARAGAVRPDESHDNDWTLGLVGHGVPEVLKAAKHDPYAAPAAPACETIPQEIAALDAVLGPDADSPAERVRMRARAEKLMFQGLRSMIPHRDVVRFVTGAQRRDKALNEAAMAGWARRGFLKGMEINLGCEGPAAAVAAAAVEASEIAPTQTAAVASAAPAPLVAVVRTSVAEPVAAPAPASLEPAADVAPTAGFAPTTTAPGTALSR